MKNKLAYILFLIGIQVAVQAQVSDSTQVSKESGIVVSKEAIETEPYNPLAPSKAAFYSAVLPGLGQAYNKKYWKIPIIYAGMATGIYFYGRNDKEYDRFRNAYKRRLAGFTDDEFFGDGETPIISNDRLIDAQKTASRNKDVSIIVALAFYMINIIDANVDAHLRQYNVSDDLSIQPNFDVNPVNAQANYGLSLTFRLK